MTQSKHTKGPWITNGEWIDGGDSEPVCQLPTAATYSNRDSNARLIAAAPDLLESLQLVANCVTDDKGGVTLGSYELGVIKAANKKAKGE